MSGNILIGLMIPFLGTSLGAACVFLMKNKMSRKIERALTGFTLMMALDVALG